MIDAPDDPTGYELGPVPARHRPAPPPVAPAPDLVLADRPFQRRVRWRYVLLGAYLLVAALAWFTYETADAARARRLSRLHRERAAAARRAAVAARREGRIDEAAVLDDRARNHAWFADAYRGLVRDRPRWSPRSGVGEQSP